MKNEDVVMGSRLLASTCASRDWLARLQEMVERQRPNVVCLLGASLSEQEVAALEALPVGCVFVSPRWASGYKSPPANTAKVIWLGNGPCKVGSLVVAGMPCKGKEGDAADIVSAGLMSPKTPRVLVSSVSEWQGKAANFQQLTVIGADAEKPFSYKSSRGLWGDAVGLNLRPYGAVVISFTFFAGHFFSMHVEDATP